MAGIYIHIPYCKVKCHYCDFHFSTQVDSAEQMLAAILQELDQRQSYLSEEKIKTIYFGGGTPSFVSSGF
jgi:oxygen-independent coproporphyrinogen-3 oxidase